jgi:mono/diheme cytochrome c family protein
MTPSVGRPHLRGDRLTVLPRTAAVLLACFGIGGGPSLAATNDDDTPAVRGEYIFRAAGCQGCHTDEKNKGELLAGGRALKTPFGTFYTPNITPDPTYGIGKWSDEDFAKALRLGESPSGAHYYPALPYTAYTKMSDQDVRDLKAYIFSLPPVAKANQPHDLRFPYGMRFGLVFWKFLNFEPGRLEPDPTHDAQWNRGRYLVEALGHCAECHTERNFLGGLEKDRWMAGSRAGAEGDSTPNLTPAPGNDIGEWSVEDIVYLLKTGILPEGDSLGAAMAEVVENSTSKLRDDDLTAIATYLKSLPPVETRPAAKK